MSEEMAKINRVGRKIIAALGLLALLSALIWTPANAAMHADLSGPLGSGQFGAMVYALPNGNIVVTDPGYDKGEVAEVGAVYLYEGTTLKMISQLTGSVAGDQVGSQGVVVLSNGNYLVLSPSWANQGAAEAGATTWCSATTGCAGEVSAANSLVGSHASDQSTGVFILPGGNYVVVNPFWDNGAATDAGAVTWCNATNGCVGEISAVNSLVGTHANDQVGYAAWLYNGLRYFADGDYWVLSPYWNNNAGAGTRCSGTGGCVGEVSAVNSLVGSQPNDFACGGGSDDGLTILPNGDYVISSPNWANGTATDAGAVTWCSLASGCVGEVSTANSLVGTTAGDLVGFQVYGLSGGAYVVGSRNWRNGAMQEAGAVTWCDGTGSCNGTVVNVTNSLIGSTPGDAVGWGYVIVLTNGNYVVNAPYWDKGSTVDAGAVTWCDGATGCRGVVSESTSLTGSHAGDLIGKRGYLSAGVFGLTNGNYVVVSGSWANGTATNAGAVTWCDGITGCTGMVVSASNSLVGSKSGDSIGYDGVSSDNYGLALLPNGNFVVNSALWDNDGITNAGAVTWCSGASGCTPGAVSAANSLVGNATIAGSWFNRLRVDALPNGSYVVRNPFWKNGSAVNAGAVTWCNGTTGCSGAISAATSLVGSHANDQIGTLNGSITVQNGYMVLSGNWDNGTVVDAGAATWCSDTGGCAGEITAANSLVGTTAGDHVGYWAYGLATGDYVVLSPDWSNGANTNVGAVTWCSSAAGCVGAVSATNSLVGASTGDHAGSGFVIPLSNGDYAVKSPTWDNNGAVDAGLVTLGKGGGGTVGVANSQNSVAGKTAGGGASVQVAYDKKGDRLVVGFPADNCVSIFPGSWSIFVPQLDR